VRVRTRVGYHEVTSQVSQKLLLINIAWVDEGKRVHLTSTSSIATTFEGRRWPCSSLGQLPADSIEGARQLTAEARDLP